MRLIDADALIISLAKDRSALVNNHVPYGELRRIDETIWKVAESPTISAVPVVRCGECKHYSAPVVARDTGLCLWADRDELAAPDGYCSHGATKESIK